MLETIKNIVELLFWIVIGGILLKFIVEVILINTIQRIRYSNNCKKIIEGENPEIDKLVKELVEKLENEEKK